jgi:hypothetical protein
MRNIWRKKIRKFDLNLRGEGSLAHLRGCSVGFDMAVSLKSNNLMVQIR